MLRKSLIILSGNAAASFLLLVRNLVVARMIPVADYGVAATFAVAMAIVEMASAFGLQQQIIQARDGDNPRFQAALQGFQILRGVVSGAVLLAIAGPIARFLGIPEAAWAYQVLAVVPVLNAMQHFDIHRLTRQLHFGPLLLTGALPAVVSLALVWPLAQWFGDWRVMLWSLVAQAVLSTLTSHLVAERPWRLVWDRTIVTRSLRFGWPLLVNGILLFLVFQGDKLIVGHVLGMEALAIFAMGVTLTLPPTLVLAKSAQNLFLPRLSAAVRDHKGKVDTGPKATFHNLSQAMLQAAVLNGALMVGMVALLGGPLVLGVLGDKYVELLPLLPAFALLNGVRVFKSGPNLVALSAGQSGNAMISNLPRVLALALTFALLSSGGTLIQVLWLGVAAETLGYLTALALVRRRPGLSMRRFLPVLLGALPFLILNGWPGFAAVITDALGQRDLAPWIGPLALLISFLILLTPLKELRRAIFVRRPPVNE